MAFASYLTYDPFLYFAIIMYESKLVLKEHQAASQTLHLFSPHGEYRNDLRISQGSIFIWETAETRRSNIGSKRIFG